MGLMVASLPLSAQFLLYSVLWRLIEFLKDLWREREILVFIAFIIIFCCHVNSVYSDIYEYVMSVYSDIYKYIMAVYLCLLCCL